MSKTWQVCVKREVTIFPGFGVTESFSRTRKVLGLPFEYKKVRFINSEWCYPVKEFQKIKSILKKKAETDPDYFSRLTKKQQQRGEALKKFVKEISHTTYSKKELIRILKKYLEHSHNFYAFWWVATPGGEIFEEKVKKILEEKNIGIKLEEVLFYIPDIALDKHQKQLMTIGLKFGTRKFSSLPLAAKKQLEKHTREYAWISTSYNIGKPLAAEDFFNLIIETNPAKVLQTIKQEKVRKKLILKKLKTSLNKKEFSVVNGMLEVIFLHNYQKQTVNECQHRSEKFLMQIATTLGVDRQTILQFTPYEILAGLEGKKLPSQNTLKNRDKYFAIILQNKKCFVTEAHEYDVKVEESLTKSNFVKGQVAARGFVRAKARVIVKKSQLVDFKPGEILVTTMTTVEFMPFMRKAAAIVTDEGGVTCHAAIYGRELGIPCVIGTKNATQTFKTGDFLEVDATQGTVKILK